MRKILALTVGVIGLVALSGCGGGGGGGSTVLMGSVAGAAGTMTGVSLKAENSGEGFVESAEVEEGEFQFSRVPEGMVEVTLERDGETELMSFDVAVEDGKTTEVEVFLLTWTPEAVAEYKTRADGDTSFGETRPIGPDGTTMSTGTDDSRTYTTPKGLVVTHEANGDVTVNDDNYTP